MKRLLFLVHRWVGVALALFMTLWFLSGLVIVYSGQLNQNRLQQLAHAEALRFESGWLSLGEARARSSAARGDGAVSEARLLRRAGEPQWLVEDSAGRRYALSAIDGRPIETTPETAARIVGHWVDGERAGQATLVRFVETVDKPAIVRNQDALRPFHRFAVDDGAGSELYVSARSGDVVHASTRFERGLYWAGNWLHLFRFLDLAGLGEARSEVLMWSAIAAFAACLSGLIVGWLRWRPGLFGKPTYAEGRVHPYRAPWLRWHFWAGLIGGSFALAWAFSGFINGNTWQLFSPAAPSREEMARYYGGGLPPAVSDWKPELAVVDRAGTVELSWRRLGDQAVLLGYRPDGQRRALVDSPAGFGKPALLAAVGRLSGGEAPTTATLQHEYDSYYYPRPGRSAIDRPLPVLRVDRADAGATRYYLDPQDGRLLLRQDNSRRSYRWLFNALHYWDFGFLAARPGWDAWMLLWIGFGLVLSVSSLVIGWKRLKLTLRPKRRPAAQPLPALAAEQAGR